ncbi:MAG: hypothetical protein JW734_07160 [Candidatus Omnitrophica bacterium]|nr:hypothetical protein [Candidatus Omnitrophota bacterium]
MKKTLTLTLGVIFVLQGIGLCWDNINKDSPNISIPALNENSSFNPPALAFELGGHISPANMSTADNTRASASYSLGSHVTPLLNFDTRLTYDDKFFIAGGVETAPVILLGMLDFNSNRVFNGQSTHYGTGGYSLDAYIRTGVKFKLTDNLSIAPVLGLVDKQMNVEAGTSDRYSIIAKGVSFGAEIFTKDDKDKDPVSILLEYYRLPTYQSKTDCKGETLYAYVVDNLQGGGLNFRVIREFPLSENFKSFLGAGIQYLIGKGESEIFGGDPRVNPGETTNTWSHIRFMWGIKYNIP